MIELHPKLLVLRRLRLLRLLRQHHQLQQLRLRSAPIIMP
jgi:hypothetical protein